MEEHKQHLIPRMMDSFLDPIRLISGCWGLTIYNPLMSSYYSGVVGNPHKITIPAVKNTPMIPYVSSHEILIGRYSDPVFFC